MTRDDLLKIGSSLWRMAPQCGKLLHPLASSDSVWIRSLSVIERPTGPGKLISHGMPPHKPGTKLCMRLTGCNGRKLSAKAPVSEESFLP